jgi:uncharacterized membrane protein
LVQFASWQITFTLLITALTQSPCFATHDLLASAGVEMWSVHSIHADLKIPDAR